MAESREELVEALERARAEERRLRAIAYKPEATMSDSIRFARAIDATYAAQDELQQWDEDHYGEDS
jgi:hypothetical protein